MQKKLKKHFQPGSISKSWERDNEINRKEFEEAIETLVLQTEVIVKKT